MNSVAVSLRPLSRLVLLLALLASTQLHADGLVYRRNTITNSRRTSFYRPQPLYRRYAVPRVHYPPRVYNYRPYRPPGYRPPYQRPVYGGKGNRNRYPSNNAPRRAPTNFRWAR